MIPEVSAYIFAFIAFQLKFCLFSVDLCILLSIFFLYMTQALWNGWVNFHTAIWHQDTVIRGRRLHYCCCVQCWRPAQTPGAQTKRRDNLQVSLANQ